MGVEPISFATREEFQAELDALADGEELELHPFEYPGPVVIKSAITIDGKGATVWSLAGPVFKIQGQGATLKNLKIEVTQDDLANGDKDSGCALEVQGGQNVLLENVEVRGSVRGLPAEEGQWRYPFSVKVGEIEHGREHKFVLRLYVPVPCKITSGVHGVHVTPAMLTPGRNEVALKVESPARDALLLGTICLHTAFLKRQISISGHVVPSVQGGASRRDGEVLYEPLDWDQLGPVQTPREPTIPVQKPSVKQPPPPPQIPVPQPPAPEPVKQEEVSTTAGLPPHASRPVSTRMVHKEVVLSNMFNQGAPPPVATEARSFEPGVKLSHVFGSPAASQETQRTVRNSEPADGGVAQGGLFGKKPVKGREPSASLSVTPPPNDQDSAGEKPSSHASPAAAQTKKKAHTNGSQSIPVGGAFGVASQPAKQASEPKEKKTEATIPVPQKGTSEPSPKHKPPKGSASLPNVFLK